MTQPGPAPAPLHPHPTDSPEDSMQAIGIHDLALATAHHVLDLGDLAESTGTDPNKYRIGLGQSLMSVPAPDEDIVTMAATAARTLLERTGTEGIRTVLFATESGVDQSKSAGLFVHKLLDLPSTVRVLEVKQACYGATAAVQAATGIIARNPGEKVLVIAADVAKYALDSSGEPTQGAGAVAMLIAADPDLLVIERGSGLSSVDVDDFWRPNDSAVALVDGALSLTAYLDALTSAWDDYRDQGGVAIEEIDRFTMHQPFTKMARKALKRLGQHTGAELGDELQEVSFTYNRDLGNTYTASMWAGLAALLDLEDDLAGRRIGLFSYGSGATGEFFTGIVQPGYRSSRRAAQVQEALEARVPIALPEYRELHARVLPSDTDVETERVTTAPYRFAGIRGRARVYEATGA